MKNDEQIVDVAVPGPGSSPFLHAMSLTFFSTPCAVVYVALGCGQWQRSGVHLHVQLRLFVGAASSQ